MLMLENHFFTQHIINVWNSLPATLLIFVHSVHLKRLLSLQTSLHFLYVFSLYTSIFVFFC